MREPAFWWRAPGLASALLAPLGAAYGAVAARRMAQAGERAGAPVICIGNFTLGGSGKTPAAIAVAQLLTAAGRKPVLLTRGYGGSAAGPVTADPARHTAADIGDEALLLAQAAPTVVSRDRVAGAKAAIAAGANTIVMDDGLQNPSLAKDLTIAVVDGRRGVGNGKVFPAGPLRAPLEAQLARCDALLVIGEIADATAISAQAERRGLPVFHGTLMPDRAALGELASRGVLAFAGIGDPEKFFATLADAGINVAARRSFPDHHRYTQAEAGELIMQAERQGVRLVTTEKDHARLRGEPSLAALCERAHVLPVRLQINEQQRWRSLVLAAGQGVSPLP
jgi:tetraacyldisaccharide 4'-kinase